MFEIEIKNKNLNSVHRVSPREFFDSICTYKQSPETNKHGIWNVLNNIIKINTNKE